MGPIRSIWRGSGCYCGLHRVHVFLLRLFGKDEGVAWGLWRAGRQQHGKDT